MLNRICATVIALEESYEDIQQVTVQVPSGETRRAINYPLLSGPVRVADTVLLNETATLLSLGTGGYDFVIANLSDPSGPSREENRGSGHIVKGRYLPSQCSVMTLEEQPRYAGLWSRRLAGMPVISAQLHSQIAPIAAGLTLRGISPIVYVMTDGAALPITFSSLVRQLKKSGLIHHTITAGQAFGGDSETVTVHSALLAAKHLLGARAAIVCQGPGSAGTGTEYGFSGIEQASLLDLSARLGAMPYAAVRMSDSDPRQRHQGVSHHTQTTLKLAYAPCRVALPLGTRFPGLERRHKKILVEDTEEAIRLLLERSIAVTSMGRSIAEDPMFFHAAAASGIAAAANAGTE